MTLLKLRQSLGRAGERGTPRRRSGCGGGAAGLASH